MVKDATKTYSSVASILDAVRSATKWTFVKLVGPAGEIQDDSAVHTLSDGDTVNAIQVCMPYYMPILALEY